MKRISLVVSILCGSFVSVAWGQQPAGKCTNDWSEFPLDEHAALEPL
jgi:hypothetical protein